MVRECDWREREPAGKKGNNQHNVARQGERSGTCQGDNVGHHALRLPDGKFLCRNCKATPEALELAKTFKLVACKQSKASASHSALEARLQLLLKAREQAEVLVQHMERMEVLAAQLEMCRAAEAELRQQVASLTQSLAAAQDARRRRSLDAGAEVSELNARHAANVAALEAQHAEEQMALKQQLAQAGQTIQQLVEASEDATNDILLEQLAVRDAESKATTDALTAELVADEEKERTHFAMREQMHDQMSILMRQLTTALDEKEKAYKHVRVLETELRVQKEARRPSFPPRSRPPFQTLGVNGAMRVKQPPVTCAEEDAPAGLAPVLEHA